jgi:hypothetical protein
MSGTPLRPFKHASAKIAPASIPVQIHKFHCKKGDQKTTRKARDPSSVQLFFFFLTYAMDKVAEPFPAFASTTSVPPSCVLLVRALMSS